MSPHPLGIVSACLIACGGTGATTHRGAQAPTEGPGEASRAALVSGDLDRAATLAADALADAPTDRIAQQVAARVALARGDSARVLLVLESASDPELVRLRARARYAAGDLEGTARDLVSVEGQDPPDGWAEAMLPLARAGAVLSCYQIEGDARASLPFVGRSPMPIIEVRIEDRAVNALVATQADLMILDDGVRREAGIVGRLGLGGLTMRNVPALVRDLDAIAAQIGSEVGAVLGLDVLLRMGVTIDFRERWVVVRAEETTAPNDAAAAPFLTLGGSFLAIAGRLNDRRDALLLFDTAGPFPLAIEDAVAQDLGHDLDSLPPAEGAPSGDIRMLTIDQLTMGQVEVSGVPAATGLVPSELSELAGAPIAGIVGAIVLQQMRVTLDAEGRRILFD